MFKFFLVLFWHVLSCFTLCLFLLSSESHLLSVLLAPFVSSANQIPKPILSCLEVALELYTSCPTSKGNGDWWSFRARWRLFRGKAGVSIPLPVGAGGTNTDSWSMSFAPCQELVDSRRVAQHPAGYRGCPSALARPSHRLPHPISQSAPNHPLCTSWYP